MKVSTALHVHNFFKKKLEQVKELSYKLFSESVSKSTQTECKSSQKYFHNGISFQFLCLYYKNL